MLGPIVGVADDGVRILFEADDARALELEVAAERDPSPRDQGSRWTDPPEDGSWEPVPGVRVRRDRLEGQVTRFLITGLDDHRAYRYRVFDRDRRQPVPGALGRFRPTPLHADGARQAFLLVSCNKIDAYPASVRQQRYDRMWERLAQEIDRDPSIRFVLHAGDQVYCDAAWDPVSTEFQKAVGKQPMRRREAWYAAQRPLWMMRYRERYVEAWQHEAVERVLRSVPNIMMCDDHDIHDGYGSRATDAWTFAPSLARVAFEVFDRYQGALNPAPNLGTGSRGFSMRALGARFVVLDGRSQRRTRPPQVLGPAQLDKLRAVVDAHRAEDGPLFVVSTTPLFNFLLEKSFRNSLIRKLGSLTELRDDLRDAWGDKYNLPELARLLDILSSARKRAVSPVVALGGDIHLHHLSSWTDAAGNDRIHQAVSSPFTNQPISKRGLKVAYDIKPGDHFPNRDHVFSERTARLAWLAPRRGFTKVSVDPSADGKAAVEVSYFLEEPSEKVDDTQGASATEMREQRFGCDDTGWVELGAG